MELEALSKLYQQNHSTALEEYFTFLRFKSISSESEFARETTACADWLIAYLKGIGFKTELWKTPNYPVIFASWDGAGKDKPTLLIYNHYDVQPVDPLEQWKTPPFEPEIRDGNVYARGAQDNKGQCFYVLQALSLLMQKDGKLPINIKMCIEGEEECGSAGLQAILKERKKELTADYLAIVDLGIKSATSPAITLGIRGITTMDVTVTASKTDLHSGVHGGVAYNPIHALTAILSKLRDTEGRITVPGFYDDIIEPKAEDLKHLSLVFDAAGYETAFGIPATGGEKAFTPLHRNWLRPTLEINGINGGYTGSGFKTVIPAKAYAKVSCRLVPGQDPQIIGKRVAKYIQESAPEGVKVHVDLHQGGGPAARTSVESPAVTAFAKSLSEVYKTPCAFILEGASIPIVAELKQASGADVVLLGLGLATDCIHAPNEHFSTDRLEKGALMFARGLELLGNAH